MPGADNTLARSQAYCKSIARRAARNFYYGFYPLSAEQHAAMCAAYAFARALDDVADDAGPHSVESRRAALARWRGLLEAGLRGDFGGDPVLPALHYAAEHFAIPRKYLFELIDGVEMDLDPPRYRTFDELYRYCYLVASTIGLICLHIFGYRSDEAPRLAEKMGIAFQLTNILRDLREDAARGRLYLPEEDLERFGIERREIESGGVNGSLRELLRFEADRAERYYREAAPLLGLVDRRSRASLWILAAIYHGILDRVRQSDYDVFSRRVGLSSAEKTGILLRGLKLHFLGGTAPFPA